MLFQRLIYTSDAVSDFHEEDLSQILDVSRRNNAICGVTGLLVYAEGHFLQLLEGRKTDVDDRYARIVTDNRHQNCKIVHRQSAPSRCFPKWEMGFKSDVSIDRIDHLAHELQSSVELDHHVSRKPQVVRKFIHAFGELNL
ncbi:MAG: BLUF domain-containing protein [Pseudomonadota bacterium]